MPQEHESPEHHMIDACKAIHEALKVIALSMHSSHPRRARMAAECVERMLPVVQVLKEASAIVAEQEERNDKIRH